VFVTLIVNVAVPPTAIVWEAGSFTIAIAGWVGLGLGAGVLGVTGGGVSGATVTGAVSVALTFGPDGGVPVAVALFVNDAVTPASEQL
jgi:hypothetical protein